MIRKCLKVIGTVAAILVGVVAVYVIYLFTTYHRIADNLPLTVEQPAKRGRMWMRLRLERSIPH